MTMVKENQGPRPMEKLAKILHTKVNKGEIVIPADKGKGVIKGMRPNEHMGILIANYQLYGEIPMQPFLPIFKTPDFSQAKDVRSYLLFQFKNCLSTAGECLDEPPVQVSTMNIFMENDLLNVHNRADVIITINSAFLMQQIPNYKESTLLEQIMENRQPLFFDNCINDVAMRQEREDAVSCPSRRLARHLQGETSDAEIAPHSSCACSVGCGHKYEESKFKRLFKQIFGDSVFHYYQLRRMQKAASLLDTGQYSVTEVGYRMGFTNLSHFSRQFEAIIGCKPKQYMKRN